MGAGLRFSFVVVSVVIITPMVRVAVIGSGYVGLVAAACFAELGHEVICVDNDARKIAVLERGETPIHEKFLPELLARHRGHRLRFSGSVKDATRASQAIFIAVGTPPSENGEADLSYVEAVSREIAQAIAAHPNEYRIVVEKSTVPVDTSQGVRRVRCRLQPRIPARRHSGDRFPLPRPHCHRSRQ